MFRRIVHQFVSVEYKIKHTSVFIRSIVIVPATFLPHMAWPPQL